MFKNKFQFVNVEISWIDTILNIERTSLVLSRNKKKLKSS